MRYLIAGGAGFLGANLARRLLAQKHSVTVIDNLSTGKIQNVKEFESNPYFQFLEHDVRNEMSFPVDGIFNLASPASPPMYQNRPVDTITTNFIGSLNLLKLATDQGVRILQASTSEIYGDPLKNPQTESYWGNVNPIGIRSCYDEGKRAAETLYVDFNRQFGTDIRIARIFNTYGPGMTKDDGRVVSNFVMQALEGRPISVYGDGSQTRSLCFVEDLITGLISLFEHPDVQSPVNLGNPNPISMLELAQEIIELAGSKSQINFEPLPSDDPKQREPDISKAKSLLGWEPRVSRLDGLQKTLEYFRNLT